MKVVIEISEAMYNDANILIAKDLPELREIIADGTPFEWIPVSERLPEDMQNVLIWFEYYRYGDYNCMYQTYGFCHVFDGKWSSFINGKTGWRDARIIAWMPLPEAYKGQKNDF